MFISAILLAVLLFIILAVVSEEFFVPAIDKLAVRLNLGSDAAGATLLAIGSSAPEFFTSLFAILGVAGSHADIGAGTIVGSSIFNILFIIGAASLFKTVKVQWQPVLRDMIFYIASIILLMLVFSDGAITLIESIIFIGTYVLYVLAVMNWRKIFPYEDQQADEEQLSTKEKSRLNKRIHWGIGKFVPDPKKHPEKYILTFLASIMIIAFTSFGLIWSIQTVALEFNVNPTFLALTILAAGTSVPDLIGSVVVAKQGRGDMAVSNAVGSNIFDILFGLGLPWFIVLLLKPEQGIQVSSANLMASIFLLFATVVALFFIFITQNWEVGRKSGWGLVSLYIGYCVYVLFSL